MGEFNLAELLRQKNVSKINTSQIRDIPLELIDGDDRNKIYSIAGIEELAGNIQTVGLIDPVVVRPNPEAEGRYILVSGHRRTAAYRLLAQESQAYVNIPAIVRAGDEIPAMQELRLIFANCHNRKHSSAELCDETARVQELLYELKEAGVEFPGRMRDHVAEACQVSQNKLARLNAIRNRLVPCWMQSYRSNQINESIAYALSGLTAEFQETIYQHQMVNGVCQLQSASHLANIAREMQRIQEMAISGCKVCAHRNRMLERAAAIRNSWTSVNCSGCCAKCHSLMTCKDRCSLCKAKASNMRAEAKAAEERAAQAQREREAPKEKFIADAYDRVWSRIQEIGIDPETYKAAGLKRYSNVSIYFQDYANGKQAITVNTFLPFGDVLGAQSAELLIGAANVLGVSLDYLLGRTEVKEMAQPAAEAAPLQWQTGEPEREGVYIVLTRDDPSDTPYVDDRKWKNGAWSAVWGVVYGEVLGWIPMPAEDNV